MRGLAILLLAASLLLTGCLGLGGSDEAPPQSGAAANQTQTNATNTGTNKSTQPTEPTGPTFAGYAPTGNASVTINNQTELSFSTPAGGFHEILLRPEEPTEFFTFSYGGGGGAHDLSTFGLVVFPPDPEGASDQGMCRTESGLSWWTDNLSAFGSDWVLDEGPYLMLAWSNGGTFRLTASDDTDAKNVSLAPSNVSASATEPEIRYTSSGQTSSSASFEASLEPADWGILEFRGSQPFAAGSYSVQTTATAGGSECANHEESGTATPTMNSGYEATFPLRLGPDAVGWTGEASYQVSPGSLTPESQLGNAQAYALQIHMPS